jgi:hypothetical protein
MGPLSLSDPSSAPASEGRDAWLRHVRTMHRKKRTAGLLGCLVGATLMLFGRFRPDMAPPWAVPAGLAIIGLSWAVFGWVIYDRWRWAKAHPYRAER